MKKRKKNEREKEKDGMEIKNEKRIVSSFFSFVLWFQKLQKGHPRRAKDEPRPREQSCRRRRRRRNGESMMVRSGSKAGSNGVSGGGGRGHCRRRRINSRRHRRRCQRQRCDSRHSRSTPGKQWSRPPAAEWSAEERAVLEKRER